MLENVHVALHFEILYSEFLVRNRSSLDQHPSGQRGVCLKELVISDNCLFGKTESVRLREVSILWHVHLLMILPSED